MAKACISCSHYLKNLRNSSGILFKVELIIFEPSSVCMRALICTPLPSLTEDKLYNYLFSMIKVKIEFLGGLDVISNGKREHKVTLEGEEGKVTMRDLIQHVTSFVVCDPKDIPVFIEEDTVRPGILVLINDTDWELEGMEDYIVESGDVFTFTSTLHGG